MEKKISFFILFIFSSFLLIANDKGYINPSNDTGVFVNDWNEKGLSLSSSSDYVFIQLPDDFVKFHKVTETKNVEIIKTETGYEIIYKIQSMVYNKLNFTIFNERIIIVNSASGTKIFSFWIIMKTCSCLITYDPNNPKYLKYILQPKTVSNKE